MIIKEASLRDTEQSSVMRLGMYLLHGKDGQSAEHRIIHSFTTNMITDEVEPIAFIEMKNYLSYNSRSKSNLMHVIVSLKPGEALNNDQWEDVAKRIANTLDMGDHPYFACVHKDTDSQHMHVVYALIQPKDHKRKQLPFSHRKLMTLASALEKEYNLYQVNHEPSKNRSMRGAEQSERLSGQQSFLSYICTIKDELLKCSSWEELANTLNMYGLIYERRGQGLTFATKGTKDVFAVKASSVDSNLSFGKLCNKYGTYIDVTANSETIRNFEQLPVGFADEKLAKELFTEFQDYKKALKSRKEHELADLEAKYKQSQDRCIEFRQQAKALCKKLYSDKEQRRSEYNRLSALINERKKRERSLYLKQRSTLIMETNPKSFLDYLKAQGSVQSRQLLITRKFAQSQTGNILYGKSITLMQIRQLKFFSLRKTTNKGLDLYLSDLLKNDYIQEDGSKIIVCQNPSFLTVKDALTLATRKIDHRPIKIEGDYDYQYKCAIAAAQMGISISLSNSNLQSLYQKELQKYGNFRQHKQRTVGANRATGARKQYSIRELIFAERLSRAPKLATAPRLAEAPKLTDFISNSAKSAGPKLHGDSLSMSVSNVSERSMAQVHKPSSVLLSDYENDSVGQHKPKTIPRTMRWSEHGAESGRGGVELLQYINERNTKKSMGFPDVKEHKIFSKENGSFIYQGLRNLDNKVYGLFLQDDIVFLKELTDYAVKRLKKARIGDKVKILRNGKLEVRTNYRRSR